ncbi:MAG TPA: hypothetical protein VMR52_02870 [Dehalococcoidia bacterium]|nr:hypothetical protein [Dehalococcoidia bacterium]
MAAGTRFSLPSIIGRVDRAHFKAERHRILDELSSRRKKVLYVGAVIGGQDNSNSEVIDVMNGVGRMVDELAGEPDQMTYQ